MIVRELMTPNVITTEEDKTILEVRELMLSKNIRRLPVVDDIRRIKGIITDGDLRRMLKKNIRIDDNVTAADIMTRNPKTIAADEMAVDALDVLRKNEITQIAVVDKETYLGIIHLHDLIREGLI